MKKSRSLALSAGSALTMIVMVALLAAPAQAAERFGGAGTGTLPQTGGSGTTWIFIIGGALILLAAIAFLVRFLRQRRAGGEGGGEGGAVSGGESSGGGDGAA